MCCLIFSRRGLAYFGVLVQLLVGLLVVPLVTLTAAVAVGPSRDGTGRDLSASQIAFMGTYSVGMCVLAVIIFKGIRTESITLLYISIASLLIFQLVAGVVTILSWKPKPSEDMKVFIRTASLGLNAVSTVAYLIILILYTRHLRKKLSGEYEDDDFDY